MGPIRNCRVSGSVGFELGGSSGGEAPRCPQLLSAVQVSQCQPVDLPQVPLSTRGCASASVRRNRSTRSSLSAILPSRGRELGPSGRRLAQGISREGSAGAFPTSVVVVSQASPGSAIRSARRKRGVRARRGSGRHKGGFRARPFHVGPFLVQVLGMFTVGSRATLNHVRSPRSIVGRRRWSSPPRESEPKRRR